MTESPDHEARISALEAGVARAKADALAARHLAVAQDHDLSDFAVAIDGQRQAINALGVQTAERFQDVSRRFDGVDRRLDGVDRRLDGVDRRLDGVDQRLDALETKVGDGFARIDVEFAKVDRGFVEMRGKLDGVAAGLAVIGAAIGRIEGRGQEPGE